MLLRIPDGMSTFSFRGVQNQAPFNNPFYYYDVCEMFRHPNFSLPNI